MPPRRAPAAGAVSNAAIVADASRYQGQGYVYGGDASRPGDWDCSSFISYVLGHDLGMALPGGRYGDPGFPPNSHGPVVLSYYGWSGVAACGPGIPGTLVIWPGGGTGGHIGICTGPNQMVSALDTQYGTLKSPIVGWGPAGVTPVYRQLTGAGGPVGPIPAGTTGYGGTSPLPALVLAAVLTGAVLAGVLIAAVLAGAGAEVALAWTLEHLAGSGDNGAA